MQVRTRSYCIAGATFASDMLESEAMEALTKLVKTSFKATTDPHSL